MGNGVPIKCSDGLCGWGAKGDVGCDGGDGSCSLAFFVDAENSEFHPAELQRATAELKKILDPLLQGPDGRKLSLLRTPYGTMLAWVKHGQPHPEDAVTSASAPEAIAAELGIKVSEIGGPATAS